MENMIRLNESKVVFYDDNVEDEKLRHTYWLHNKQLQGVTSTLVRFAFPDMYKGISKDVLQNAAQRGNNIHDVVQAYAVWGGNCVTPEEQSYQKIAEEYGLSVVDTEYLVSDERELASAIDMVVTTPDCGDDAVYLVDIKTTAERHYDAVSLQLSIYAGWFERQNPHLKVKGLMLLWLRGDEYRYEEVSRVSQQTINGLRKAWKSQREDYVYDASPKWLGGKAKMLQKLMEKQDEITKQIDAIKSEMLDLMNEEHYYSLKGGGLTISKVAASQSPRFNSSKFQAEHGDLYSQYVTMTKKKEYLTIKKNK